MFTYKFVPDDVVSECSECVHELCLVHGLTVREIRASPWLSHSPFLRAIRVCVTASDALCPRGQNSWRTCVAQIPATRPHTRRQSRREPASPIMAVSNRPMILSHSKALASITA